jgi:hypothetical protein
VPDHEDELINRIGAGLRVVAPLDERFDARVMAEIASLPQPVPGGIAAVSQWLRRPLNLRVSPLAGLAAAAALAAVLVWNRQPESASRRDGTGRCSGVLLARHGSTLGGLRARAGVRDVGRRRNDGCHHAAPHGWRWSVALRLVPGRHRYAFVLDGVRWIADPLAPPAPDDDFGSPGSVVTVGA